MLLRSHPELSLLRRAVQVDRDQMPPRHLQRERVRLLQAVQLQAVLKRALLQRHSPAADQVGRQPPQRLLGHDWYRLLLDVLLLLDVHLLQVNAQVQTTNTIGRSSRDRNDKTASA